MKHRPPADPRAFRLLAMAALAASLGWLVLRANRGAPPPAAPDPEAHLAGTSARTPATTPAPPVAPVSGEPWHEPVARTGVDASNFYKNAFVLFDQLTEEEIKMIRAPKEEVDAEKAAALFEKIRAIMDLLREAAAADYCEWGLAPYSFDTPMPHITKAQDLGRLALWAAAYQFPTDPSAALDDLAVRGRLGHHLADTVIGLLVETNFEKTAHDLVRENLGSFDAPTASVAARFVLISDINRDIARAFASEVASVASGAKQLAATSVEEGAQLLGAAGSAEVEKALAIFSDPARLAAEVAFIRATEDTMSKAMKWPEAQFQTWWKGVEGEIANGHPLAQLTIPNIAGVQARVQQRRVERTILGAGLDVLQNGPAQLARYRDPATGKALTYVRTPSGFDLRSTYQVKGKPVTFSFPQP